MMKHGAIVRANYRPTQTTTQKTYIFHEIALVPPCYFAYNMAMLKNWLKSLVLVGVLATLSGCSENTIDWKKLKSVTDASSLQSSIDLEDNTSLISAGLSNYKKLLQSRTTENQDRAKLLYSRIEMHASSAVILAGDYNHLAELELLHLGWSTSLTPPYTHNSENRARAFEASAAIYRTMPLLRPVNANLPADTIISASSIRDAIARLNELCSVATNPWSATPGASVDRQLLARVNQAKEELSARLHDLRVDTEVRHASTVSFAETKFPNAIQNVCVLKKEPPPFQ